jgi:hypothetical protein
MKSSLRFFTSIYGSVLSVLVGLLFAILGVEVIVSLHCESTLVYEFLLLGTLLFAGFTAFFFR